MTREEAINILHGIRADNLNLNDAYTKDKYEALDMAIKALEQEPVIDKIRAEIEQKLGTHGYVSLYNKAINDVLQIIDKYKAESEDKG